MVAARACSTLLFAILLMMGLAACGTSATGTVGLWTKADSVTCFDNVQIAAR